MDPNSDSLNRIETVPVALSETEKLAHAASFLRTLVRINAGAALVGLGWIKFAL